MRTIQDIMESLCDLSVVENPDYIEVTYPIEFSIYYSLVTIRIYTDNDCYYITDEGYTFDETNDCGSYYFDLYKKAGKYNDFGITLEDETFCKEYSWDFDIRRAVDEFVRFLIYFDDFMSENNLC